MGTQYHITVVRSPKVLEVSSDSLKDEIDSLLQRINQQMSTYIDDSEISQFNRYMETDWYPVSEDLAFVVSSSNYISEQTLGAFDITVSPLVDLWGFGSKSQIDLPKEEEINKALHNVGYRFLEVRDAPAALRKLNKNIKIDLSAIAKGFAVDKIATLLSEKGINNYLVEIGGEIRLHGLNPSKKPWRVGIEAPDHSGEQLKAHLLLSNTSVATSGDYNNYFVEKGVRYSHTIDPRTGRPITHNLSSVTVLHDYAMVADAYATALSVMGEDAGRRFIKGNKRKIRVSMITREKLGSKIWQNIEEIKTPETSDRCQKGGKEISDSADFMRLNKKFLTQKEWEGCVYFD